MPAYGCEGKILLPRLYEYILPGSTVSVSFSISRTSRFNSTEDVFVADVTELRVLAEAPPEPRDSISRQFADDLRVWREKREERREG